MDWLDKILNRIMGFSISIGVVFLMGAMLLMVANIAYRFFGGTIPGTYELVGPFISVTAALALAYTAHKQGHVVIDILINRIPKRINIIFQYFCSAISLCFCLLLAWSSTILMLHKLRLGEETTLFKVPIFPFRGIWVLGLVFFCLVFLADLLKTLRDRASK